MILETNLDDVTSELLGSDFQMALLKLGAIDFYLTSIQMKKGRPDLMLSVLIDPGDLEMISQFILEHSPSIGIRYYPVDRIILERKNLVMQTPYGPVKVKQVITPSGAKRHKIEHESLQNLKDTHNISILRLQEELYPLISKIQHNEEE